MSQPNANWYWFYDADTQTLRVNMQTYEFVCACKPKMLLPFAKQIQQQYFAVDDTYAFNQFYVALETSLRLSEAKLVQICLNATAVTQFCTDESPKSWFFTPQPIPATEDAPIVVLESGENPGLFLRLKNVNGCAYLMLLSSQMDLVTGKTMRQFDCIKVMQDRLASYAGQAYSVEHQQRA
ncbi:cell division protein ZapC domain-containing protein [Gayadomonas joobiniege]|uniref:cell division protein ZapC domain-containing protein n=1 Tax=Gayadomonas joobiniege TaxID=1234606 RepID=UPI000361D95D|nr:cell division protein ZapC domain-containing protein [Gayadomonas joobiniege]